MCKTVFLDRDGTINEEVNYLHRPEDLKLLPMAAEAIRLWNDHGFRVVVVTNQAGVARGYYQEADVEKLHQYMNQILKEKGAHIDAFYYCPHHPEHGIGPYKIKCHCRKPDTGMFEAAERDCPVDKAHSYMVGDKWLDTQAGARFGVHTALVGTGYGRELYEEVLRGHPHRNPDGGQESRSDAEHPMEFFGNTLYDVALWTLRCEEYGGSAAKAPASGSLRRNKAMTEPINQLKLLIQRYPQLAPIEQQIHQAYEILEQCYERGGKLLVAGNGGSCADSEHMVGELMKGFCRKRPVPEAFEKRLAEADPVLGPELAAKLQGALPAIALTGHPALSTAYLNDVDGLLTFAQQVYGYGTEGDVLLGISTSGNSKNILYAMTAARAKGMKTIGLTGRDGGALDRAADAAIIVPEQETYWIQELHLPIYHTLCLMLEEHFFPV